MSAPRFATPTPPFNVTVPLTMVGWGAIAMSPAVAERWDSVMGEKLPSEKVRTVWWTTIAMHVGESVLAARRAKANDLPVGRWVAQTMVCGVFSLAAQRKVIRGLDAPAA